MSAGPSTSRDVTDSPTPGRHRRMLRGDGLALAAPQAKPIVPRQRHGRSSTAYGRCVGTPLYSDDLERFISRHFGGRGRVWLDQLAGRVEQYQRVWGLEIERYLPGGLMSCCLAVRTADGARAVLKLDGPWTPARREILALRRWSGRAAPDLLHADEAGGALLLERIEPGTPLADGALGEEIVGVARLLRVLHASTASAALLQQLPPLADVVEEQIATAGAEAAARSAAEATALRPALERARDVASRLLESWDRDDVILHGDLESKNILICHKRGLAAIDPLACVGEPAYDAAYCAASALPGGRRDERCGLVAAELGLDPERVRRWASVVALDHPC